MHRLEKAAASGFTLVEVVAVLTVLAILAGTVAAALRVRPSVSVEADMLRSRLGFAQALAMANNTAEWSVRFDNNAYRLLRDGADSPLPWPGTPSAAHGLPDGITIAAGAGLMALDEWGAPPATRDIRLTDGSRNATVRITEFTGLVP